MAAGVRLVMAGYNAVNGTTMTANALLTDPLKSEWGFDGVVVSDWGAVRGTTGTARAGLDLAMPGPDGPWGEALARAVAEGAVPEPAVDDKARRLLRLAAWLGALGGRDVSRSPVPGRPADSPGAEGADGGAGAGPSSGAEGLPGRGPAHGAKPSGPRPRRAGDGRALARRAVAAGAVLLANKDVLPLDPEHLGTVAVIGAHAARTRTQGGGSAGVFPRGEVSVLDGIRAELRGRARVVHVPGPRPDGPAPPLDPDTCTDPRSGLPGVLLRMLDADGRELYAERRRGGRLLEPRLVPGAHTVEIRARLCPRTGGSWSLGVAGFGRMSLTTDGRTLLEGTSRRPPTIRR